MSNSTNKDIWDIVIAPAKKYYFLNFDELWRYRDLLLMLVKRDFVAQYKQTLLGPIWHIIQPLFTTIIYFVVFTKIAKISTNGIPPVLFYLTNITMWNYFSSCLTLTSNTFTANAWMFNKVYFPRLIMPISVIVSNIIKFFIQFVILLVTIFIYKVNGVDLSLGFSLILIIPILITIAFLAMGSGMIISSLTVKYRDLTVLISFSIQLLMYATPVVYPITAVFNSDLQQWILLNPLSSIFESYRYIIFHVGELTFSGVTFSLSFAIIIFFLGLIVFQKVEKNCMDTI